MNEADDQQKKEIRTLKKISQITTPYVFSNAPDIWTNTITEILLDTVFPTTSNVTTPYIKPNLKTYKKIETHLKSDSYIFVDDKIQNLPYISPKWTRVWMNDTENLKLQKQLYFINELEELFYIDEFYHLIL